MPSQGFYCSCSCTTIPMLLLLPHHYYATDPMQSFSCYHSHGTIPMLPLPPTLPSLCYPAHTTVSTGPSPCCHPHNVIPFENKNKQNWVLKERNLKRDYHKKKRGNQIKNVKENLFSWERTIMNSIWKHKEEKLSADNKKSEKRLPQK